MTTSETAARAPVEQPATPSRLATPMEDLVTVLLGACIILGAATDGWAHRNILSEVQEDGFFTPWHALLYSGFAATAGWTVFLAYRRRQHAPRWWLDGWPAGYRLGALGIAIFLFAGFMDMVWHETFGIEVDIDALLSPSHLLLCIGSVLLLTSPARSWWAAGGGGLRAAAGAVALALGATSASVFLGYVSMFEFVGPTLPYDGTQGTPGYSAAARGVASYVVTVALLLVPLLLAHRRRATVGVGAALVAWVAMFPVLTHGFPGTLVWGAIGGITGAIVADWLLVAMDRWRGPDATLRLPAAGAIFAAVVSAAHLLAIHLASGIQWPVELWTGAVVTAAAVGALLGGLAARPYEAQIDGQAGRRARSLT